MSDVSKTPKVDDLKVTRAVERLLDIFTLEQVEFLANQCETVAYEQDGYGSVEIQFQDGKPRFLTMRYREKLPKPQPNNPMDDD